MAKARGTPKRQKPANFTGRLMVDTVRGVLRVRKWPRKRGKPTHATTIFWNEWFTEANLLTKYVDAATMRRAIQMTTGTPQYPRDVILAAMRGRLYSWADENGWKWFPMAAINDISESLDVLGQTIGDVLVRATDRWRPPPAGSVDDVLTYKGPLTPPVWQSPGGGGGATQSIVPGTPIVPDGTQISYDVDVDDYAEVCVQMDGIGFDASSRPLFRFSTDGGTTFHEAASDYQWILMNWLLGAQGDANHIIVSNDNGTSGHNSTTRFTNLRAGRCDFHMIAGGPGSEAIVRAGFANFDGPITDIRMQNGNGKKFDAGTIRFVGLER